MANSVTKGKPDGGDGTTVQGIHRTPRKGGIPRGRGGPSYPPGVGPGKQMTHRPDVMSTADKTYTPYRTPRKGGIPGSPRLPR